MYYIGIYRDDFPLLLLIPSKFTGRASHGCTVAARKMGSVYDAAYLAICMFGFPQTGGYLLGFPI